MFVGSEGKPTRRHGVPWSDPPIATASTSPYVLAVLPRHIEVRSTQSLASHTLVQTVPLRGDGHTGPPRCEYVGQVDGIRRGDHGRLVA